MSKKQVAVILSGSGVFDGTEINEAVITFLTLEKAGLEYKTFAPNITQDHIVNHTTSGFDTRNQRNVLDESNRITRGETLPLEELSARDFDALIFIGGFGAAKNLSTFAKDGLEYSVSAPIEKVIQDFNQAQKYIVAMCIAPVLLAKTIDKAEITIGTDITTSGVIENSTSATHINCEVNQCHIDTKNKLISTPAYMLAQSLTELETGITATIQALTDNI